MQPLPIVPMIGLLTESNAPAWVAAALLPVLLGIAAWALVHIRGGQREHCTAGAGATGFTAAPVPPPLPPPLVPGLPVLGSALALGAGGAAFLERCREQVDLKLLACTCVFAMVALPVMLGGICRVLLLCTSSS